MWELDLKKVEHWRIWTVVLEKTLESPLDCKEIQPLNSTWTNYFQMFKVDFKKAGEPEIKLPTSAGSLKKQESSRKTSASALMTIPKALIVWTTTNCGKFLKKWNTRPSYLPVNPKGNQSWIETTDAEIPILWPPDVENQLIGKDSEAGKDWRQEEKWVTENEMLDGITTQWTWVWARSRCWWWTRKPVMLQSMRSQRVGHNWATELNWVHHMLGSYC